MAAPIFIVSPPRAGGGRLLRMLARSPATWCLDGAERAALEALVDPTRTGTDRLDAASANDALIGACRAALAAAEARRAVEDKPEGARLLDQNPRNALRIPFLARAFPDARFVYLYRDPRENVSRMLDAWRSGGFVTHAGLPGWNGPAWSLTLVPGWEFLDNLPLAEVVARQWDAVTRILLDDLAQLPPERWCLTSLDKLLTAPAEEVARLCDFLGLDWDETRAPRPGDAALAIDRDEWRHNAAELRPAMPLVLDTAERARQLFASAPATRAGVDRSSADAPARGPTLINSAAANLGGAGSDGFVRILDELGISLIVTTRHGHRLALLSAEAGRPRLHFRAFGSPMHPALGARYLALVARRHVWLYRNQPESGRGLGARPPDACFLPHALQVTGDLGARAAAFAGDTLWLASARFSCLASLDADYSFRPQWRPPFVSALAAEDRCHLNGIAVVDDRVRYVTALGKSDSPQGWRARRADGGCVVDVEANAIIAEGLCLPHTPRWHQGRLWLTEGGLGTLGRLDAASGKLETVVELPGFARGLAFAGPYAFVGVSRIRAGAHAWTPLLRRSEADQCGIRVVDTRNGAIVGMLRFSGPVEEILDIVVLPGIRSPELVEPEAELVSNAFVLPEESLAECKP